MADPAYVARIRAYLEQHRETYDQTALRAKLLADGHPVTAVDLALAQVFGYEPPALPATPPVSGTGLLLPIVATFFATYISIGVLTVLSFSLSIDWILFLVPAVLPLEIVAALVVRRRNPQLARGIAWGIAAAWGPIIALVLLFGICLVIIGGL